MHQARKILFKKWRSPLLLLALASLLALLIGGHLNGNQAAFAGVSGAQVEEVAIAQVNLAQPFEQFGLEGSVLIYDQNANQFTGFDVFDTSWPKLGWFVGYLEQNDNVYFFATNADMQDADDLPARIEVTRRSLKALGLF